MMRLLLLFLTLLVLCEGVSRAEPPLPDVPRVITTTAPRINELILSVLGEMPAGGGYSTTAPTSRLLASATAIGPAGLTVQPERATPSYCSGATYLVFLRVCQELSKRGHANLDPETLSLLLVRGQADGDGVWGRWNANGPGTGRLFHEAALGRNFTDFGQAQRGDFMKIFWNAEVGRSERGHSVIFLGQERVDGVDHVRFWSSNKPDGYGEKSVPRTRIVQAIFSRFENPRNLSRLRSLPARDPWLASLLTTRSSIAEAHRRCGL